MGKKDPCFAILFFCPNKLFPMCKKICSPIDSDFLSLFPCVCIFFVSWDRCYNFKNILPKNSAKKLAFFTQNKAKLCKILIITLVFEKNANFFAENCRKSQKIVIITSTPGWPDWAIFSLIGRLFGRLITFG
jgi:hypothetical protein